MKINEVTQLSGKAIFESLKADKNQPFNDDTLMEISENVANAKFTLVEDVGAWLDSLVKAADGIGNP